MPTTTKNCPIKKPPILTLPLDPFTLVDVFSWLDRRALANRIELTCWHFKQLIATSALAKRPHHLIENALLLTDIKSDGWQSVRDECKEDITDTIIHSSCIPNCFLCDCCFNIDRGRKSVRFTFGYPNKWIKLRYGKTKMRTRVQIHENWVNSLLRQKKCCPSVVAPIYVRFVKTYISADIFDEMTADFDGNWSANGEREEENIGQKISAAVADENIQSQSSKQLQNCTKASQFLMALLALMLSAFEGTTLEIWADFQAYSEWTFKNDAYDLANVFAHPTMQALIAACKSCICMMPTLLPRNQLAKENFSRDSPEAQRMPILGSILSKGKLRQGILLSGPLQCDRFCYRGHGSPYGIWPDYPMFSVVEVSKWLHSPIVHPRRPFAAKHLLININSNTGENANWLNELEKKLIHEFIYRIPMANDNSGYPIDDDERRRWPHSPRYIAYIRSRHLMTVEPCLRQLAGNPMGSELIVAYNHIPETISQRGWEWPQEDDNFAIYFALD